MLERELRRRLCDAYSINRELKRSAGAFRPAGWDSVRGLEPGYAYGQSGGRIPQSLPRGRFGGGLWQLHLSAAWTSHNTARFRLRGRTLELTAAGFSTGIEGGAAQDCSSAIPSSSGCEPGRGGERGRFGEAGGIEGGAAQGLGQGANPL